MTARLHGLMRSVAIASQKGGSGKSTVTVHLAVAAMRAGARVAIIDTDPQASAIAWSESRTSEDPAVVAIDAADLASAIAEARSEAFDVVFVDTAPRASGSLANAVAAVDWVVIPLRPSAFDVATAERTARIVAAAGTPFAFLLNACPYKAPEIAESRNALAELGPVLTSTLGERRIFARALQTGESVQEFDARSEAAREIAAVWSEIQGRLNVEPIQEKA